MAYLLIERQGNPGRWKFCEKSFQTVRASLNEACKDAEIIVMALAKEHGYNGEPIFEEARR